MYVIMMFIFSAVVPIILQSVRTLLHVLFEISHFYISEKLVTDMYVEVVLFILANIEFIYVLIVKIIMS